MKGFASYSASSSGASLHSAPLCNDVIVYCVAPNLDPFDTAALRACCKRYQRLIKDPLPDWHDNTVYQKLRKAAKHGRMGICRWLVEEKGASDFDKQCAYELASLGNHLHICWWLIENGIDPNWALYFAARCDHLELCKYLITEKGASNFDQAAGEAGRWGALNTCKYLLEETEVLRIDWVINAAAGNGNLDICKMLIEKGLHVSLRRGALRRAIDAGHQDIVDLLSISD